MIKIILIIVYVIAFGASAVLFLFYGRKNGWRGGVAVMISAAAAFVASYFLAPAAASGTVGIQPVRQLIENAADTAAKSGLDGEALTDILSDAAERVLEIPFAIVLYIVAFVVVFVLTGIVMKHVKPKNAGTKPSETESKSRLIGAVLGAAAPVIVAVLTLFVSKIDLFNEAETADSILVLTSKSEGEIVKEFLSDPDSYTKILFETTIIGADENQRLEFVSKSVNDIVSGIEDSLLLECFDFEGYSSRSEFESDVKAVIELYNAFDGMDPFADGDFAKKVLSVTDKDKMAENLYRLSFKDGIIRYVMSYAVRSLTDNDSFVYPKYSQIPGDYKDFADILSAAEKYENGEISQLDLFVELKKSPLMTEELSEELYQEMHDEVLDWLNGELDEVLDGERFEEVFEELYEELYDAINEELNEGLDQERIKELYDELYDKLNGKLQP